jgi:hypothetical protein
MLRIKAKLTDVSNGRALDLREEPRPQTPFSVIAKGGVVALEELITDLTFTGVVKGAVVHIAHRSRAPSCR